MVCGEWRKEEGVERKREVWGVWEVRTEVEVWWWRESWKKSE